MIRGALILATGFAAGYAKAVSDQDELKKYIVELSDGVKGLLVELQKSDSPTSEDIVIDADKLTRDEKIHTMSRTNSNQEIADELQIPLAEVEEILQSGERPDQPGSDAT